MWSRFPRNHAAFYDFALHDSVMKYSLGLLTFFAVIAVRLCASAPWQPSIDTPPPYQKGAFRHPAGLHTTADLERMKAKVAAKESPWFECWEQLVQDPWARADYKPAPKANMGVSRQRASQDAHAAYLNFIRGYISDDARHIDAAIRICNDWAATVDQVPKGDDIPGLSGIPTAEFAIVGELLRASPRWRPEDQERFKRMLTQYLYPVCHDFLAHHNGADVTHYWANWDIANIGALIAIGVFCDRPDIYDEGVAYYLRGEGMGSIVNAVYKVHPGGLGQWQESGRDQPHARLGVGMLAQACQIAWNQGLDLYGVADNRLLAGAEYVAATTLGRDLPFTFYTNAQPANNYWLSNHTRNRVSRPIWELLYNHYVVVRGQPAPHTTAMARLVRPERGNKDHFGYGTLTFTLDGARSPYPPHAVPPAPSGLVAKPGILRVELSWTAPAGDIAQGYAIRRATSTAGPFTTISRVTDNVGTVFVDKQVEAGTTYHYEIASLNQSGTSEFTGRVAARPVAPGPMPTEWRHSDLGETGSAGFSEYAGAMGNTLIVRGAGSSLGGVADSFGFAHREVVGDFELTARVVDVVWTRGSGRVGLVMRESLTPGARTAFVTLGDIGARQTRFGVRGATNGSTSQKNGNDYTWLPVWFRLKRTGDVVTASHSADGVNWFEVGASTKVDFAKTVLVGLAACSQDGKTLVAATFDHVTLSR